MQTAEARDEAVLGATDRRRPTVDTVAAGLVGVLSFLIAVRPALDNDLWFHLRTADWMLEHHRWVGMDPFNHTRPGVVRVQTDWLAQLTLHGAWRIAGLAGIALLVAVVLAAAMVLLYRAIDGPVRVRAGVCLLVAASSSIFWSARPQTFTFLGMVLVVSLLWRWRRNPASAAVWWLVPLFLVWVNTHGGVIYGVLIVFAVLAGELGNRFAADRGLPLGVNPLPVDAIRRLAVAAVASTAVLVVNPSGVRVYGLPFHQVASAAAYVQEVQPPSLGDPTAWPFFVLVALTVGLVVRRRQSLDLVEVVLLLGTLAFALRFVRSVPFFAVVAAPIAARHLAALVEDRDPAWRARAVAPAGLVVVLLGAVTAAGVLTSVRLDADRVADLEAAEYPVGAVAWLEANEWPRQLYNTFDWGGYLMWRLPDTEVSIDGRTDVYDEYLAVYDSVIRAEEGWDDELDRVAADTVLVDPQAPLAHVLRADDRWHVVYEDPVAEVFIRT